jgi:hypothetical protein
MSKEDKPKVCFVIAPTGGNGSADHIRSDQALKAPLISKTNWC